MEERSEGLRGRWSPCVPISAELCARDEVGATSYRQLPVGQRLHAPPCPRSSRSQESGPDRSLGPRCSMSLVSLPSTAEGVLRSKPSF